MSLTIHQDSSKKELFTYAAKEFFRLLDDTLREKPFFDVALSGGTTALEYLNTFITIANEQKNLNKIRFFFSDERAVPTTNESSNAGNAMQVITKHLPISHQQFFPMFNENVGAAASAFNYENLLLTMLCKTGQGLPRFDLIYLGIGSDGHTASLFPHSPLLKNIDHDDRLVRAVKEGHIPHERITFMPKLINASTHIHIIATGAGKAEVIDSIVNGPLREEHLPAQMVLRKPKTDVMLLLAEMGQTQVS